MKCNETLISVIMNCKNGENFIDESVGSLLNQSYLNWELIFWDNASQDESLKKIKSYKDKRFRVFKSKKNISYWRGRFYWGLLNKKIT